ncbi:hypothetical protein [Candidatus Kuenenia stuttgartiensis]|uniref:hypothetical protein n=1 Tax=Kuenenia stuttgartiensis TaxID=174633 RepID=UPI00146B596F|nr:hypothetical protein [Candidatus Kuenenia stuttgartiensis]
MKTDKETKKVIFFCPGPEYLFYNTGIYCLWELSRSYSVVLLLDFPYHDLNKLEKLKEKGIVQDYIYIFFNPTTHLKLFKMFKRHWHYYRVCRFIFAKYQPTAIIQHNDYDPLNIYWFKEASFRKCKRIRFNASHSPDDPNRDIQRMQLMHINSLQNKFKIPYWLAFLFHYFNHITSYYFGYYIVPFVITGRVFKPSIRSFPIKKKWYNKKINYYEHSIAYSEKEKKGLVVYCGEPATAIRNPLYDIQEDVFFCLYGPIEEMNTILILLTASEMQYIAKAKDMPQEDVIQFFFDRWSEAIDILKNKFINYKIFLKLKPGQSRDIQFQYNELAKRLLEHNGHISIIPSEENTQKLILEAKIIVTSYSSVLWWANHLKTKKILISLDIFDIPEGDLFSNTEGICYFDSLEALAKYDFSKVSQKRKSILPELTLTAFMKKHVGV